MIKLMDGVVTTLLKDGSTAVMNVDSLSSKLKRSWHAAGYPDDSLAEDVALSVELALSDSVAGAAFTPAQIDEFVLKVLREAGLTEVAEHYGLNFDPIESAVLVKVGEVSELIRKFLRLDEPESDKLAGEVVAAASAIGSSKASPTLLVELARHLHLKNVKFAEPTPRLAMNADVVGCAASVVGGASVWRISKCEILNMCDSGTRRLVADGILSVGGVSALFPSIKLEFDIAKLAGAIGLTPPIPEFALLSSSTALVDAVNDIVAKIDDVVVSGDSFSTERLPIHLKIVEPELFTELWLGGKWPESRRSLVELLETLSESFPRKVSLHA